ncbi:hypothetical protein CPB97_011271 [Podila verticillata]|nr:hypothetical protein CPB97_011271 [Podila verticillata]
MPRRTSAEVRAAEARKQEIIAINHRIEVRKEFECIMDQMKEDTMSYIYEFKKLITANNLGSEAYESPLKFINAIDACEDYVIAQHALLRELDHHNVKVPRKRKLKGLEPRAHSYAHSLEVEEITPDPAQLKQLIVSALWGRKTIPVYKDTPFVAFVHLPLFRSCVKRPKLDLGSLEGQPENPITIMYLVNTFFEEYETALKTLLSKKLFDDTVQYYIRDCIADHGVLLRYNRLIEQKLPKGDRDWAVVKRALYQALDVGRYEGQVMHMLRTMRRQGGEDYNDFYERVERILKASGADEETKQKWVMRMISKRIPAPVSEEFQRGFVNRWPNIKPPQVELMMTFFALRLEYLNHQAAGKTKTPVVERREESDVESDDEEDDEDYEILTRIAQPMSKKPRRH